jgi:hypothetical protein
MNQRQTEKLIKQIVHDELEPFRIAYAKQETEIKRLNKKHAELLIKHAELIFQKQK